MDAVLVVTPYYNKPNRRGLVAHFTPSPQHRSADDRLQHPRPHHDQPGARPAHRAGRIDNVVGVKQANSDMDQARQVVESSGLAMYAGDDNLLGPFAEIGGAGGITVSSHLAGEQMKELYEAARAGDVERARALDSELEDVYRTLFIAPPPATVKAALGLLGFETGGVRLPLVEVDESSWRRSAGWSSRCGPSRVSGTLRVLPLGGLGEIGKNMTVVEYDGRIVVVDTGLMFPTPEQLGIDLVLPDFTYLRERAEDIEAIVLTHGHEDHVGALPWILRDLGPEIRPPIYSAALTVAMARSKIEEHKLNVPFDEVDLGDHVEAGPFDLELIPVSHSIPDARAVALTCELGTMIITGDYKFDQTPVDGPPTDAARLAELGSEECSCCAATRRTPDRRGTAPSRRASGRCSRRSSAARGGSRGRDVVRIQRPPPPAGDRCRRRARQARRGDRALDAQEPQHRAAARPRGRARGPAGESQGGRASRRAARDAHDRQPGRAPVCAAADGASGAPAGKAPFRRHDHLLGHADPGNERAVNETVDRLYQIGATVITTQDAAVHASGHGWSGSS